MESFGAAVLPVVIGIILVYAFIKGLDVFDSFITGAREGIKTTVNILPTLIGLIVAVSMLRASGLLDAITSVVAPAAQAVGISPEIVPLMLLRPVSGSGSSAYTISILEQFGPDSQTGMIASVLSSATETTFYAIAVYFGATKYKKLSYTVPVSLLGDFVTAVMAIITVKFIA